MTMNQVCVEHRVLSFIFFSIFTIISLFLSLHRWIGDSNTWLH